MTTEAPKKVISLEELKAHSSPEDLYILIHNKVYAVSKFLDEHPGGDEVITAEAGKDATEAFEDVGHSDEAREVLAGLYVGEFVGGSENGANSTKAEVKSSLKTSSEASGGSIAYLVPAALIGAFLAWRFYFAP